MANTLVGPFLLKEMWVAFAQCESYSHFCSKKKKKKINVFVNTLARTVNQFVINKLFKLTMLWTTGPWIPFLFRTMFDWVYTSVPFLLVQLQFTPPDKVFFQPKSIDIFLISPLKCMRCVLIGSTSALLKSICCATSTVNVLKFWTLYSILCLPKFCFLCSCFLKYFA